MLKVPSFQEEYFVPAYGVHRWKLVSGTILTAVSAPDWEMFAGLLNQLTDSDILVVSPELMTVAGFSPCEVLGVRKLVEDRIEEVKRHSHIFPQTLFILGTPTFGENEKPRNSALFIQNGVVVGSAHKRSAPTDEERVCFDLVYEEPPALIGNDTGVIICADLATATLLNGSRRRVDALFSITERSYLMGKQVAIIHPNAGALVVLTCWAVGGNIIGISREGADLYYRRQLTTIVRDILVQYPQVDEVVVVDRVPNLGTANLTPQWPLNAYIKRKEG